MRRPGISADRWPTRRTTSRCTWPGPELGGLRYDYRRPKHPYGDKFMLAGGHCIPTCYALWMIMGQALARKYKATGDKRYYVDPHVAMLGYRRAGLSPRRRRARNAARRTMAWPIIRCSPKPKGAASGRWPGMPKAPI